MVRRRPSFIAFNARGGLAAQYELTSAAYQLGAGRFLDMQDAEVALQGTRIQILNERLHLASLVYDFEAKYEGAAAAAN